MRLATCFLLLASCLLLLSCSPADRLDRILETGVLRVGMDASYPPFESIDGKGNLVGLDVDLGRELARGWGWRPVSSPTSPTTASTTR
jgi:ABC-type amino acid transport substrate-binding protein